MGVEELLVGKLATFAMWMGLVFCFWVVMMVLIVVYVLNYDRIWGLTNNGR